MRVIVLLIFVSLSFGFAKEDFLITKYYGGFEGYQHPVTMVQELDYATIDQEKRSYYIAEYNKYDRLGRMQKVYKGKEIYRYEYSYYSDGAIKAAHIYRRGKLINTIHYDIGE